MERGNGAALGNGHIAGGRRAGQETLGDVRAEAAPRAGGAALGRRRRACPGAATNLDLAFVGGACVGALGPRRRRDRPRRAEIVQSRRPIGADAREIQELHLAHALRPRAEGYVLALLGQSLDGSSPPGALPRYINGEGSLTYLHRLAGAERCGNHRREHRRGGPPSSDDAPRRGAAPGPRGDRPARAPAAGQQPPPRRGADAGPARHRRRAVRAVALEPSHRPAPADGRRLHRAFPNPGSAAARGLTRLLIEGGA